MKSRRIELITALVMVLFLLVLVPHMASGGSSSSSLKDSLITIRLETEKSSYLQGEVVKVKVYVINSKNEAVMYPTSIWYSVFDSKGRGVIGYGLYITWENPIPTFPPQTETLFRDATFLWNQKDINTKKVAVDTYTIKISLDGPEISLSSEITIRVYPNIDAFPRASRWGFIFY